MTRRFRAGIHDQSAALRSRPARESHRAALGGRAADTRARLAGAPAGATPLLLEEREVGAGLRAARRRPTGVLGAERLSHARRSMAGRAVRRARPHATRDQQVSEREQETWRRELGVGSQGARRYAPTGGGMVRR